MLSRKPAILDLCLCAARPDCWEMEGRYEAVATSYSAQTNVHELPAVRQECVLTRNITFMS